MIKSYAFAHYLTNKEKRKLNDCISMSQDPDTYRRAVERMNRTELKNLVKEIHKLEAAPPAPKLFDN